MESTNNKIRECAFCRKEFKIKNKKQIFCGKICGKNKYRSNYLKSNPNTGLSKQTIGTISELKICCDLLEKGFEIFRAVSTSCSCDLAILKNGKLLKIEVTTAHMNEKGIIFHGKKSKKKKFDYLAVVTKCGKIIYEPEFPDDYGKKT